MNLDKLWSILGSIIVLAIIGTVLTNGASSNNLLKTFFSGFQGLLKTASGK